MKRPRWLIVIQRDKPGLYANLRESLASNAEVEIVLDRRQTETPPTVERRRTAVPPAARDLWETLGLRVIYRGEDVTVCEDPARPSEPPRPPAASTDAGAADRPR